jgi:predicted alpha/beta hydrolase
MNPSEASSLDHLSPCWYQPQQSIKAVVLIASAMAVRQDYYVHYARFLASEGYLVATFDYRLTGFKQPKTMRGITLTFDDWADDLDQMIVACKAHALKHRVPLAVSGHSLGGQLMGFAKHNHEVDALFTVGSGTGYWRHNHHRPLAMLYLWFVAMPLFTRLFGYFPGAKLKKVGDLSKTMALTWSRWCRHPEYYVHADGSKVDTRFSELRAPITSWSFTDDDYIPKPACDQLHGFYANASLTREHFAPNDLGEARIGHFGFFKLGAQSQAWQRARQTLESMLKGSTIA